MAGRSRTRNKTRISSLFTIPVGAEEEFVRTETLRDEDGEIPLLSSVEDDTVYLSEEFETDGDPEEPNPEFSLDTPTEFSIISQTVRRSPGGQQVIDIIIEVEDIIGATDYEVYITKV